MGLISVICDSREPAWCHALRFGGINTSTMMLDAGDLLCATDKADLLVIERKTVDDFLNTLRDGRLFPQIAKLREVTPWAYLAICGDIHPGIGGKCLVDGRETGWQWASVSGALLTVQELGVNILWIASDFEYEEAIVNLGRRDRETKKVLPPRDITIVGEAENILASLPGIGAEKAGDLLAYCKTPATALQLLTDETLEHKIPGIAGGTRNRVRKALGLDEGYILAEVTPDMKYKERQTE